MESKGGLISKFLSPIQQLDLVNELVFANRFDEAIEIISFTNIDLSKEDKIIEYIFESFKEKLYGSFHNVETAIGEKNVLDKMFDDEYLKTFISLIDNIPSLWNKVELWLKTKLIQYTISNNGRLFDKIFYDQVTLKFIHKYSTTFENIDNGVQIEDSEIELLLTLLEKIFLWTEKISKNCDMELDGILLYLQGSNIESIAVSSSKLMRWKEKNIVNHCLNDTTFDKLTWKSIEYIYQNVGTYQWKERNALCFHLRYLTISEDTTQNLLNFIKTDTYWKQLQLALNHRIHENRKLALSILKLTIKKLLTISEPFESETFSWVPSAKGQFVKSWEKFTTLYEIVALDTALNQIQAARQDILNLFKDQYINSSWSLILFATGLHSSMESVRKYILSLIFQVEDLSVFSSNLDILQNTILLSTMQAQFYNVESLDCPYGDKVSDFVSQILAASETKTSDILTCIFNLLIKEGSSFDPARIYMSYGVLKYLENTNNSKLSLENINQLRKLFQFECEEEIFEMSQQTIYLKMLLYVQPDVHIQHWLETLKTHLICTHYDYKYFRKVFFQLKYYAVNKFNIETCTKQLHEDYDILLYLIFDIRPATPTKEFLVGLCKSKFSNNGCFKDEIYNVIELGITNDDTLGDEISLLIDHLKSDEEKMEKLYNIINMKEINNEFNVTRLRCACNISSLYLKQGKDNKKEITLEEIFPVYDKMLQYYRNEGRSAAISTKDKDFASCFDLISDILKENLKKELSNIDDVLLISANCVERDNGHYHGNLAITKLLSYILDHVYDIHPEEYPRISLISTVWSIMSSLWNNLNGDRLVLKERVLHLKVIETLFHKEFLKHAIVGEDEVSFLINHSLCDIGRDICNLSVSRRGFLPLLGKKVFEFSKLVKNQDKFGKNYLSLVVLSVYSFIRSQIPDNIFKLKPVIGNLYDHKLNTDENDKSSLYTEVYGPPEMSVRTSIINAVINFNDEFRDGLIKFIITETNAINAIKRIDGPEEAQRVLLWELCILCLALMETLDTDFELVISMIESLKTEASPLVRILKEWFIAFVFTAFNSEGRNKFQGTELFALMEDHSQPVVTVSAQKILYISLKALFYLTPSKRSNELLNRFVSSLITNATSNKPLIRHFSNSLILSFWPAFKNVLEKDKNLNNIFEKLYSNAKSAQIVGKYRSGDANTWNVLNLTLTNIFGGMLRKMTDHNTSYISKKEFTESLTDLPSTVFIGEDEEEDWLSKRDIKGSGNKNNKFESSTDGPSPLQTKSGAWETVLDLDNDKSNESVKRSDLIVLSSLVDKPPNLGGICRLCDVLGVGLLTVQDIRVKNHPQFKNVAVTADKWMPMKEVPVVDITEFMKQKKKEGYTLIGLEQTDRSVKLNDEYKFPKKSLILLGTEAHGIPGDLLSELDLCLEIQQFGVIRSMNIQTATAVIVHSYTIQHM
ncbi:similar to Saccharomyces cerevisiae YDL112W TRM3 2'-O-ribose methyltransferase, catalyzes the ribose methylation of the guanosine nucleotide at position 18 of tRNAs [Maudiozyma saulgeensis]|uniref:Similar to Saccharomyces cerevisiae YDL112W TRM3 2'-O-ribose methyltransferase, catalyzes the ribose methylation of the guanosine nucleotide at position 18 of tRNAs n=1 Tax=Maudiozyma saulgeensis TaxID=1789683 RepID=A0A1X7QZD8_9SACH|nr:similar to Saccharomyces cerevisiae YDL112W TRM3 2'-O-ribose methyltransferase, catalyzes the ribose methylation of the guanosine nucleotide at position 18 of tRNAs [Kazachstania saulgeensis]